MAETRKHRPRTSAIGDQVRASVDSGPRPVSPGEYFDPFVDEPDEADDLAGVPDLAGFGVTTLAATDVGTSGWFSVEVDALQQLVGTSHTADASGQADALEDEDELDDELELDDESDIDDEDEA